MLRKLILKQDDFISIVKDINERALKKKEKAKQRLKEIRSTILTETENKIKENEERYRELCKRGLSITNPKALRSLELRMILHRLEHQAQKAGRSRYDFDFDKFIYLLRITSDIQ